MSKKKPTGFHSETPPPVQIPENRESKDSPDDDHLEIKNPFLANLFHYGMIGLILLFAALLVGSYSTGRHGGGTSSFFISGILGAMALVRWFKSKDYIDKDQGGF